MEPYDISVGGISLNPGPPREAVRQVGGGMGIGELTSINGTLIFTRQHRTARRVTIASPGDTWALPTTTANALRALEASGTPFTLVLGSNFQPSGTFTGCYFDGDVLFETTDAPEWHNYSFTVYVPQEA